MSAPYRSNVIGSLLRPDYLIEARGERDRGELDAAAFKRIEDRAVDEALALQADCGLDICTDGEMRREWFTGTLTEAIDGLEQIGGAHETVWHGDAGDATLLAPTAITGKLRRTRSVATEEFTYSRARSRLPVKVTLPSPMALMEFWSPEHSTAAYANVLEVFEDAVDILRDEARVLQQLGCQDIQLDAPELAVSIDPSQAAYFERLGFPRERMLSEGLELLNAVADVPGVRFSMHMCRGNHDGMWLSEGGYDTIAKEAFRRTQNIDVLCLEYDDYRSGSFEPLAEVPDDKLVMLGLVSTKREDLEPVDALVERVEQASAFIDKDRLGVSTQCGFAPVAGGHPLSAGAQEAKLRTVARVADEVWG